MFGDCLVFGNKPIIQKIFSRKKGYITIPADVPLDGLDLHEEE